MSRPAEEPTTEGAGIRWDGKDEGLRTRHPAFGQIRASRISGFSALYGSDFMHQHYIEIAVVESTLDRALSNDVPFGGKEVCRVALSEAQWASFVSQAAIGAGTPCTLRRIGDEDKPALPPPESRVKQFSREASDAMAGASRALAELRQLIVDSNLSAKKAGPLLDQLRIAERGIGSNQQFVLDQFGEHMEGVIEKARIEVNAMTTAAVIKVGEAAIVAGRPALELIAASQPKGDAP